MGNQLFKNKYRIKSIRLKDWDYSSDGAYYITICTKNRECLFGNIIDKKMMLNNIGEIIKQCWYDLPNHYGNCRLDEFIIMPDHIHGIIIIDNDHNHPIVVEAIHQLPLLHELPLQKQQPLQQTRKLRRQMLIPKIIGKFKMQTTKSFHEIKNTSEKLWQRDYFEHIIRDDNELNRIRKYIINNPLKWEINHS